MTLAIDASLMVAALVDSGAEGTWADELLRSDTLIAPHLLPVEVDNVLRRAAIAGDISADSASLAHADLLALRIDLFAYEPFTERVWELRETISAYHAWYVALAESVDAPLATLDRRLARSQSARCRFITPPSSVRSPEPGPSPVTRQHPSLTVRPRSAPAGC